jgi:hypothetical protein
MSKKEKINVQGTEITIFSKPDNRNYLSITDIARYKNPIEPKDVVKNWLRSRTTIEFLGLWEKINNPDFKGVEFDPLLLEAGTNAFAKSRSDYSSVDRTAQPLNRIPLGM